MTAERLGGISKNSQGIVPGRRRNQGPSEKATALRLRPVTRSGSEFKTPGHLHRDTLRTTMRRSGARC
jgi:hypothetical protein